MNNVVMGLAFFSSVLVGGIAIKNTFERFADEIKTEIAILATKNNKDIQNMTELLKGQDFAAGVPGKRRRTIYEDDYVGIKAEKIYEICKSDAELVNILLQLETLVERKRQDEQSVHEL